MILDLYHGRTDTNVDMEDGWGFQGPVLTGVLRLRCTYTHMFVMFVDEEAKQRAVEVTGWKDGVHEHSLEMGLLGDMIVTSHPTGENYYGDWDLHA